MEKIALNDLSFDELVNAFAADGLPKFRAAQTFDWLHSKQITDFDGMTNLSKDLIVKLKEKYTINLLTVEKKLVSQIDGTVKYLFGLSDGNFIETVLMRYKHGSSVCVSSQVGCKMGCTFCASTKAGFVRNLTAGEIAEQVYSVQRDCGERISNIVIMGIGEPLDNYDNVLKFLYLISDKRGNNLSLRHLSLSTCGLVDKIDELAKLKLGLTLSVSLHAPDDEIRNETMPINRRYNIETLIAACKRYAEATSRRISFEYALISGKNDSRACAERLSKLLKGMLCHVNLIPVNEIKETGYRKSGAAQIEQFKIYLEEHGITTTVRRTLGSDINAACGQLRREYGETEAAVCKYTE